MHCSFHFSVSIKNINTRRDLVWEEDFLVCEYFFLVSISYWISFPRNIWDDLSTGLFSGRGLIFGGFFHLGKTVNHLRDQIRFNIFTLCELLCQMYDLPAPLKRFSKSLKFFMYFMLSMVTKRYYSFVVLTKFSRIKCEDLEPISILTLDRLWD